MVKISNEKIRQVHNDLNGEIGMPPWATDNKCVSCELPLEPSAIRGVSLCTNARYLGDISVEVCCTKCSAGYEMHFRLNCLSWDEYVAHLKSATLPVAWVPDFKIANSDNNLIRNILQTEESEPELKKE